MEVGVADQPRFQNLWSLEGNDALAGNVGHHHSHPDATALLSDPPGHRSACTSGLEFGCLDPESQDGFEEDMEQDVVSDEEGSTVDSPRPGKKRMRMSGNNNEVTIFPRKKAGQDKLGSNRPPIIITREVLENYFDMPQQLVCKKLGICATVIKKVCRQLGIEKWPYKGNKIDLRKRGLGPAARKDFLDAEAPAVQTPPSCSTSSTCVSNDDSSSASERKDDIIRVGALNKKISAAKPRSPGPPALLAASAVHKDPNSASPKTAMPSLAGSLAANRGAKAGAVAAALSSNMRLSGNSSSLPSVAMPLVPKLEPEASTDIYVPEAPSSPARLAVHPRSNAAKAIGEQAPAIFDSGAARQTPARQPSVERAAVQRRGQHDSLQALRAEVASSAVRRMAADPAAEELRRGAGGMTVEMEAEGIHGRGEVEGAHEGCDLGWLVSPDVRAFDRLQEHEDLFAPYRHGPQPGWV